MLHIKVLNQIEMKVQPPGIEPWTSGLASQRYTIELLLALLDLIIEYICIFQPSPAPTPVIRLSLSQCSKIFRINRSVQVLATVVRAGRCSSNLVQWLLVIVQNQFMFCLKRFTLLSPGNQQL